MPTPSKFTYKAFLSYAHVDAAWGKRIHSQLESFPIDKDLAGRATPLGPVPKSLRPIFRDREDFASGHTLTDATIAALDNSATLIVICSKVAAARPAVNEEVRLFRWRHPERSVIPVIIDGTWPDNFPPSLRFEIEKDGSISNRPVTILGADLRESGDGQQLGLSKIVAGLVGVGTDEIARRAERDRSKKLRNWIIRLSIVIATLAGLAVWAEINRREAVTQKNTAERNYYAAASGFIAASDAVSGELLNLVGTNPDIAVKIIDRMIVERDRISDFTGKNGGFDEASSRLMSALGDALLSAGRRREAFEAYRKSCDKAEEYLIPSNATSAHDLLVCYVKQLRSAPEGNEQQRINLVNRFIKYSAVLEAKFEHDRGLRRTVAIALGTAASAAFSSRQPFDDLYIASILRFRKLVPSTSPSEDSEADALGAIGNFADALISSGRHDEVSKYIDDSYAVLPEVEFSNDVQRNSTIYGRHRIERGLECRDFRLLICLQSMMRLLEIAEKHLSRASNRRDVADDYASAVRMTARSYQGVKMRGEEKIASEREVILAHFERLNALRPLNHQEAILLRAVRD